MSLTERSAWHRGCWHKIAVWIAVHLADVRGPLVKSAVRVLVIVTMLAISVCATDRWNRFISFAQGAGEVRERRNVAPASATLSAGSRFLNLAIPRPISEANSLMIVGCGLIFFGILSRKKPRRIDSDK
jgi:hypothetical protein